MVAQNLDGKHYTDWVAAAIALNSWAVYQWIQRNYNNPLPLWARGAEFATANRNSMQAFLAKKTEEAQNSAQYLINFLQAIPNK